MPKLGFTPERPAIRAPRVFARSTSPRLAHHSSAKLQNDGPVATELAYDEPGSEITSADWLSRHGLAALKLTPYHVCLDRTVRISKIWTTCNLFIMLTYLSCIA